jgi:hypothetical protein
MSPGVTNSGTVRDSPTGDLSQTIAEYEGASGASMQVINAGMFAGCRNPRQCFVRDM